MLIMHENKKTLTAGIMNQVLVCLLPGIIAKWYFFGTGVLIQLILAVVTSLILEVIILNIRKKPLEMAFDGSAFVSAILIAISIPVLSPWWITVTGVSFAIIVVKHLYGGLGQNIFNPAMAGYVLLLVSFPVQMTAWISPSDIGVNYPSFTESLSLIFSHNIELINTYKANIDGTTMATPLDGFKHQVNWTSQGSSAWFIINCVYLLGGIIMLGLKTIRIQIPISFLLSIIVLSAIGSFFGVGASPWFNLFSGATMLGAFFIITDPVAAPSTDKGKIIYGSLIGILVYIIRTFGNYPDALAFAVLLANITSPLIDYYIKPISYGHGK